MNGRCLMFIIMSMGLYMYAAALQSFVILINAAFTAFLAGLSYKDKK